MHLIDGCARWCLREDCSAEPEPVAQVYFLLTPELIRVAPTSPRGGRSAPGRRVAWEKLQTMLGRESFLAQLDAFRLEDLPTAPDQVAGAAPAAGTMVAPSRPCLR